MKKEKVLKRKVTKPLPVKLTDREILQYGKDMVRAMADTERIETEFDSVKKDYKAKIAEQQAVVDKFSPRIHSGIETRDIECVEIKNWTNGTVRVNRMDTGEIIESRPMREDEKQMEMSGVTPDGE